MVQDVSDDAAIRFQAQVIKLQTMADGGWRLTLDILEPSDIEARDALDRARRPGIILEVAAVAVKQDENRIYAKVSTRSEWQS